MTTLAGIFIILGFWFGEGTSLLRSLLPAAVGLVGCLIIAFLAPVKTWLRVLGGVALLALYVAAFIAGAQSSSQAFNDCVERGDEVRTLLSEYREKNGQFPDRLSQLDDDGQCARITRPSILEYTKTKDGYFLTFGDFVRHSATESEIFNANK